MAALSNSWVREVRARLAAAHLDVLFAALHRACAAAIERQRQDATALDADPDSPITDREVAMMLDRVERRRNAEVRPEPTMLLTSGELRAQQELREFAEEHGIALPMDVLTDVAGLDAFDLGALLVVAAPEFDRGYGPIYAYLSDDQTNRCATPEVVSCLAEGFADRHHDRRSIGPLGKLRRSGLVVPAPSSLRSHTDLRTPLLLGRGVLEFLLGANIDPALLFDTESEVRVSFPEVVDVTNVETDVELTQSDPYPIAQLAAAFDAGLLDTVGMWGSHVAVRGDAVREFAARIGCHLVVVTASTRRSTSGDGDAITCAVLNLDELRTAALRAACANAILWINLGEPGDVDDTNEVVAAFLASTRVPVVMSGPLPRRGAVGMANRSYADVTVHEQDTDRRRAVLQRELPHFVSTQIDDLARHWRLSAPELRAAVSLARTASRLDPSMPDDEPGPESVERGCAAVSAVSSGRLVRAVTPRRGPDLLVLPEQVHRQVTEIAAFTRSMNKVVEDWGFGRMMTGGAGVKALFVGDPGTGKTLAAEVIAHVLGVQLLKVDLSQMVSKWVGETAKHLDAVFREAASGNSVLFFDEADALFGKRGEVRHGTDRYANTEVSHLLQRFEQHSGLVILASNLRQNIDPAFARRFDSIIEFARPERAERLRLWSLAFPPAAPLDADVDVDFLSGLDMTGAAIVGAARLGALFATDRGSSSISMADVVAGIIRQYQTEGRILTVGDLAQYGHILSASTSAAPSVLANGGWR